MLIYDNCITRIDSDKIKIFSHCYFEFQNKRSKQFIFSESTIKVVKSTQTLKSPSKTDFCVLGHLFFKHFLNTHFFTQKTIQNFISGMLINTMYAYSLLCDCPRDTIVSGTGSIFSCCSTNYCNQPTSSTNSTASSSKTTKISTQNPTVSTINSSKLTTRLLTTTTTTTKSSRILCRLFRICRG